MLTIRTAAKLLNLSPATLYRLVAAKQIPHIRLGTGRGKILFQEPELHTWLESRHVRPALETSTNPAPNPRPKKSSRLNHLRIV
ncbi:helix-turn-helix domain-containing protein [Tuwongella immobilis]|uniref:Excisionase family dna binding domain-containing protein:: HTH_17 n=1 Tax=Tuwongella immobilis TaxID=692036 RepID=A0A6C2YUL0_9BACT|nr:helix-turn-helix domain-containing protein [Tuwongella immobilis]VIP05300.1 excisionase family dna binding domain-containing protein : : HTH_17 [Tuwongella immobilis]VTS07956.1 excisionase family dna binding domain-containing protein : : HTH_17 [Tuwongella immobilis]